MINKTLEIEKTETNVENIVEQLDELFPGLAKRVETYHVKTTHRADPFEGVPAYTAHYVGKLQDIVYAETENYQVAVATLRHRIYTADGAEEIHQEALLYFKKKNNAEDKVYHPQIETFPRYLPIGERHPAYKAAMQEKKKYLDCNLVEINVLEKDHIQFTLMNDKDDRKIVYDVNLPEAEDKHLLFRMENKE